MAEVLEHGGRHYAVQFHYALPDDAWCVELSEARPTPKPRSEIAQAPALPGPALIVAMVPDENPTAEPTIHIRTSNEPVIPYVVMRWFMEQVANEVERTRAAMQVAHAETTAHTSPA